MACIVLLILVMSSKEMAFADIGLKIHQIRGESVMLDHDLALLYQVPTKRLNEQVSRNLYRFPSDFMYILTYQEVANLKSQIATSSYPWGGRRKLPRVFTEQGISMLSSVLQSPRAVQMNILIMRIFVQMRKVQISNKEFEVKLHELERKYHCHDNQIRIVFDSIRKIISESSVPRKRIIGLKP